MANFIFDVFIIGLFSLISIVLVIKLSESEERELETRREYNKCFCYYRDPSETEKKERMAAYEKLNEEGQFWNGFSNWYVHIKCELCLVKKKHGMREKL